MQDGSTVMTDTPTEAGVSTTVKLTAQIVAAFLSNNAVPIVDLSSVIRSVHRALADLGAPVPLPETEKLVPAISIKKSVTPDYIVCLEDGKQLKMLKRHLNTTYGMTPDEYRAKWGLPSDYPMVAPNYAAQRSSLAKSIGLGRKPVATPEPTPVPTKRPGRPK